MSAPNLLLPHASHPHSRPDSESQTADARPSLALESLGERPVQNRPSTYLNHFAVSSSMAPPSHSPPATTYVPEAVDPFSSNFRPPPAQPQSASYGTPLAAPSYSPGSPHMSQYRGQTYPGPSQAPAYAPGASTGMFQSRPGLNRMASGEPPLAGQSSAPLTAPLYAAQRPGIGMAGPVPSAPAGYGTGFVDTRRGSTGSGLVDRVYRLDMGLSRGPSEGHFYDQFSIKHRRRTTPQQLHILERQYEVDPRPDLDRRKDLAQELDMTAREVQVWFQNRRAKTKKLALRAAEQAEAAEADSEAGRNSDSDASHARASLPPSAGQRPFLGEGGEEIAPTRNSMDPSPAEYSFPTSFTTATSNSSACPLPPTLPAHHPAISSARDDALAFGNRFSDRDMLPRDEVTLPRGRGAEQRSMPNDRQHQHPPSSTADSSFGRYAAPDLASDRFSPSLASSGFGSQEGQFGGSLVIDAPRYGSLSTSSAGNTPHVWGPGPPYQPSPVQHFGSPNTGGGPPMYTSELSPPNTANDFTFDIDGQSVGRPPSSSATSFDSLFPPGFDPSRRKSCPADLLVGMNRFGFSQGRAAPGGTGSMGAGGGGGGGGGGVGPSGAGSGYNVAPHSGQGSFGRYGMGLDVTGLGASTAPGGSSDEAIASWNSSVQPSFLVEEPPPEPPSDAWGPTPDVGLHRRHSVATLAPAHGHRLLAPPRPQVSATEADFKPQPCEPKASAVPSHLFGYGRRASEPSILQAIEEHPRVASDYGGGCGGGGCGGIDSSFEAPAPHGCGREVAASGRLGGAVSIQDGSVMARPTLGRRAGSLSLLNRPESSAGTLGVFAPPDIPGTEAGGSPNWNRGSISPYSIASSRSDASDHGRPPLFPRLFGASGVEGPSTGVDGGLPPGPSPVFRRRAQ